MVTEGVLSSSQHLPERQGAITRGTQRWGSSYHENFSPCKCSQATGHHLTEALGVGAIITAVVVSRGRLGRPM